MKTFFKTLVAWLIMLPIYIVFYCAVALVLIVFMPFVSVMAAVADATEWAEAQIYGKKKEKEKENVPY